jgi:hypothetical protein
VASKNAERNHGGAETESTKWTGGTGGNQTYSDIEHIIPPSLSCQPPAPPVLLVIHPVGISLLQLLFAFESICDICGQDLFASVHLHHCTPADWNRRARRKQRVPPISTYDEVRRSVISGLIFVAVVSFCSWHCLLRAGRVWPRSGLEQEATKETKSARDMTLCYGSPHSTSQPSRGVTHRLRSRREDSNRHDDPRGVRGHVRGA